MTSVQDVTDAGWNPDPTGRHELRYWDGSTWTDHVSDRGVAATDPIADATAAPAQASPAAQPTPARTAPTPDPTQVTPTSATPPATPVFTGGAAVSTGRSKTSMLIGGAIAVAVVVAAGAFFLLRGDDTRDVGVARAGLLNILDETDAPSDVTDEAVDIGACPFDFAGPATTALQEADRDVTDVDADTNLVVVFLPPDEQTLTCGVFADDDGDGYFFDIYISSMGEGRSAQELVDLYNELSADTDIDIELTDLGKADGGEMFRACADQFILPGDNPDDFLEDPYCDTVWVSDGLIVGVEQFGSQSIGDDDAKTLVLALLDEVLATLEGEA